MSDEKFESMTDKDLQEVTFVMKVRAALSRALNEVFTDPKDAAAALAGVRHFAREHESLAREWHGEKADEVLLKVDAAAKDLHHEAMADPIYAKRFD